MSITTILKKHYNLHNCSYSTLEGYDSINYKITNNQDTYVFKQVDFSPQNLALLQAENKILESVSVLHNYDFSLPISTTNKELLIVDNSCIYRLLTYVEGQFLGDVKHTPKLLNSLGTCLAEINLVLGKQYHAAIAAKESQWNLNFFKKNYAYLDYISNAKDKSLVDYFFMQFDEHVYPVQHQLRKGLLYNDANHWNVLTNENKITGIIDFGDICSSWLINEVAVALTYVLMDKEAPLEIAIPLLQGYHSKYPLKEQELDVLYYLIAARLCTSVCNSAYTKTQKPNSEYITISEKPAWRLLRQWIAINPIKAKNTFRKALGFKRINMPTVTEQKKRRLVHSSKALSLSYEKPIAMTQSAFQYMFDTEGNTILDAYNNIMLAGHCHPTVVKAGQKAMATLNTNTRYLYEELLRYSEKLLAKFPNQLNKVFFVNSGSAASDLAIRMAKAHSKKTKIMGLEHGYHGNTATTIAISHYKYNHKNGIGKTENSIATPIPKVFGSGYVDDGSAGIYFAGLAKEQIKAKWNKIAAFIAEPIVGCGGQVPLPKGYLEKVYAAVRAQGGICISDEVQVGFGRLGDWFWGYEMYNVVPDMIILGKPMGNGHPIGAVITTNEIATSFANGPEFFSSFGGNPVSCAIGEAVLDVIEEEQLQQHAKIVGEYLVQQLKKLQKSHPAMADIRGSGLFLGIELLDINLNPYKELAAKLKNQLRAKNILVGTDGPYNNVIKIKPPLSFTKEDADVLTKAIDSILKKITSFN